MQSGFFHALCQANPIAIASVVPRATLRQANCYYSSSDAAFADRYQASEEYARVAQGTIDLDGGWRVYSSGAGISLSLIMRRFLGLSREADVLRLDPVIPAALDGLRARLPLWQSFADVRYRIGAAGCGVQALRLNGQPLAFQREAHAHRAGPVTVARDRLQALWRAGQNELEIQLG